LREVADDPEPPPFRPLSERERQQLTGYVDRFNARDFDALRAMLAEDVRLDLVGRTKDNGKGVAGNYFSRYEGQFDWRMDRGRWRAAQPCWFTTRRGNWRISSCSTGPAIA
jgi:RNA polymerase sigma-70 factor (ECF subfamily)